MRLFILIVIAVVSLCYLSDVSADDISVSPKSHPKICVVLSGGGARGFAHIGVLKYLEELRVPIDCIAGTSMGAVVGGLYASGMSVDEIEKRLDNINLSDIALDIVDRRTISQTLREDDANYPISGTFGLSNKGVTLPRGAVEANQFLALLQDWTSHLPPNIHFDKLAIPFRAVATDLQSGDMVVFKQGSIATVLRASTAVPGVFAPIEIDGRLLSDGSLVRNLPVDIARDMGADIIIAVNIGTPLLPRAKLDSFFNISQQMLNILTEQNVNEQKKLLTASDILIDADLGTISFMDFTHAREAAHIGYKSAQALHDNLAKFSLTPAHYLAQLNARPNPNLPEIKIGFLDVRSPGTIPAEDIRRQLNISLGDEYRAAEINRRISSLINSRQYDSVVHSLVQRGNAYGVEVEAKPRSWGPNFLRFGLKLTTGFDGQSGFNLQVGHRLPWITESGLEWRNDLQFGNIYGIRSELRQPLMQREGIYLAPYVNAKFNSLSIYENNQRIAEYGIRSVQVGLDLGIPLGDHSNRGEIRTGLFAANYHSSPKLGGVFTVLPDEKYVITSLSSDQLDEIAWHSRFVVDQLDAPFFPSDGYRFGGELIVGINRTRSTMPFEGMHSDFRGYRQATVDVKWAKSIGDNSVNLTMQAGARAESGPAAPGIGLSLGGFQQLTAYQPDQFYGNYLLYGNATYLFRALNFKMASQAIFVGTSLELGQASEQKSDFALRNLKKSLSVFVGAKTFMGPVYFGVAAAPAGAFNVFLQFGRQ
jgi:NTE family protein